MSLFYADLDDLKKINDAFGHKEGDAALVEAAGLLRDAFRDSDIIARLGGDEFVVLAIDVAEGKATALARRLRERVQARNARPDAAYPVSFSLGIARYEPGQARLPRGTPGPGGREDVPGQVVEEGRRGGRLSGGRRPSVPDPVLGQLVVERRPGDGQDLGRLAQVPLGHLEEIDDVVLLQVLERGQVAPAGEGDRALGRDVVAEVLGQVGDVDEVLLAEQARRSPARWPARGRCPASRT